MPGEQKGSPNEKITSLVNEGAFIHGRAACEPDTHPGLAFAKASCARFSQTEERGTQANLLKTPSVGTKPTPDGARLNGSRCGPAKPRPRLKARSLCRKPTERWGPNGAPQRKRAHTDAVPHGKPAPGALPHGKKKQQHRTMLLQEQPPSHHPPHGEGFEEWRTRSRT